MLKRYRRLGIWLSILTTSFLLAWGVTAQGSLTQEQLQQAAYAQQCGTCHLALPASVFPSQTWRRLLLDPEHYGVTLEIPSEAQVQLAWGYLQSNSRSTYEGETIPFRLDESRYFKAMHPDVEFVNSIGAGSCIDCHHNARQGDFVSLQEN